MKLKSQHKNLTSVQWQDLVKLKPHEVAIELLISLPWLLLSLVAAAHHWYVVALLLSFVFFLTGLRQNHNANHYAIGISKKQHEWLMFVLSIVMLGSMHVVQINHIRHHQYYPDDQDIEAISANRSALFALLIGPVFPLLLIIKAFQVANKKQWYWIVAELLANIVVIVLIFFVLDYDFLRYHIIVMALGQCLTAFFAVWSVHHDCDPNEHVGRTIRNKWLATLTFNMFYHMEHHLYPAVPTCHLALLANRIDQVDPNLAKKSVFSLN